MNSRWISVTIRSPVICETLTRIEFFRICTVAILKFCVLLRQCLRGIKRGECEGRRRENYE